MLLLDTVDPLFGLDTGVRGTDRATYIFLLEEPLHDPLRGDLPVAAVSARNTFLPVDVVGHV